jgi:hypothetical protein
MKKCGGKAGKKTQKKTKGRSSSIVHVDRRQHHASDRRDMTGKTQKWMSQVALIFVTSQTFELPVSLLPRRTGPGLKTKRLVKTSLL